VPAFSVTVSLWKGEIMKREEILVGATYKVLGKKFNVRIELECPTGGWTATNLQTGGTIKISSPAYCVKMVEPPAPAATKAKKARKAKTSATAGDKPLSLLSAAAKVLADRKPEALHVKQLLEAIVSEGLWTPGAGKTPEQTLSGGMQTEIAKKGEAARFRKVDKGAFAAA
jgi:hypothetical protein